MPQVDIYNGTEFKYKVLKRNKHCKYISIEPKNGSRYEYLSIILLDSVLIKSNKHCPQILLKNAYTRKIKKQHY